MRIQTYLPALETAGGVELHVLEVSRELAARGHEISLFYERDGNLTDEFRSFCHSLSRGGAATYGRSALSDPPRIAARALAASRQQPDIVYANNISELAWANAVRSLTGAAIVCQMHEFRPFRRRSLSLLGSRVSHFVVASRFMQHVWSEQGIDAARVSVIPCGFDLATYSRGTDEDRVRHRTRLGLPPDAYVVLYLGRVIPEKGIEVLFSAWRELAPSLADGRLLIVGTAEPRSQYTEDLRAQAPPACDWPGPTEREVIGALHAADVLVLPSTWHEAFGRVLLEAMATGIPAVASAVGGIPEILTGEFEQMLFPRGDGAALADRLRWLRDWRVRDPGLADRCRDHVALGYSLADTVTRLETIFGEVAPDAEAPRRPRRAVVS